MFEKKDYTGPIFARTERYNPFKVIEIFNKELQEEKTPNIADIIKDLEVAQKDATN